MHRVAFLAGLALALSGHSFSLIAAGHMGKFYMLGFAVLMIAALDRGIRGRSVFYLALAGISAGYGFVCQADIMFLFFLLAGAYGVFLVAQTWPTQARQGLNPAADGSAAGIRRERMKYAGTLIGGGALAAILAAAVSAVAIQNLVKSILPQRAAISAVSGQAESGEGNKWEFATNWSLPPEEIVEFFAPGIFGYQTGDPRAPYWGRLGRTLGWEQHHRGLMNLRQHGVHLGVIQFVFAAYAVAVALGARRRITRYPSPVTDRGSLVTRGYSRADVLFWAVVLVVTVMLALGRYFPLYRLFYMLPYASSMRCPVKFLHLSEVALCILFAYGLDAFWRAVRPAEEPGS